jgi:hypothetical protein
MIQRATNPARNMAHLYLDKGVCERWHSFENFLEDMGPRPAGYTLERENGAQGYSPENCIWATPTAQARNKRNNKLSYGDIGRIFDIHRAGATHRNIACYFNVSHAMIGYILRGRQWA